MADGKQRRIAEISALQADQIAGLRLYHARYGLRLVAARAGVKPIGFTYGHDADEAGAAHALMDELLALAQFGRDMREAAVASPDAAVAHVVNQVVNQVVNRLKRSTL